VQDRAKPMVRYFEAATQTSLPPQINPANWMLDVIGVFWACVPASGWMPANAAILLSSQA
jgi:hypothetical protein